MNRIAVAAAALALVLSACRGDDTSGDDTPMVDAPLVVGEVTVQEIQDAAMPVGTVVEVKGVVVTAIDSYGNRTGDLWVQEVGGGAFSGVKVFGAPLDQIAALAVGDIVDITGAQKDEFAYMAEPDDPTVTELKPVEGGTMTITKVGTGVAPTPADVDAAAISLLATPALRDAEWEKWEGVLIKVTKVRQLGTVGTFGSNPGPDSNEFRGTGVFRVQSALTELPATAVVGTCYQSITGVGDFFFNVILAPRSAADLVVGGTNCRPAATTIAMLQSGTDTETVNLTQVIVTARDDIGTTTTPLGSRGLWVADSLAGAANNGVYVFIGTVPSDPHLPTLSIGARVDIAGAVEEFDLGSGGNPPVGDKLTEVTNATFTNITAAAGLPTPATTASVATLSTIGAAGEPWEGVLVRVSTVKVTNANAGAGKVELTDNNGDTIIMDNDSFNWPTQTVGTCYATLTGVMSVQINDNIRTINPRNAGDLAAGTGCN